MSAHAWVRRRDRSGWIKELVALRLLSRRDPITVDRIIEHAVAQYHAASVEREAKLTRIITDGLYGSDTP